MNATLDPSLQMDAVTNDPRSTCHRRNVEWFASLQGAILEVIGTRVLEIPPTTTSQRAPYSSRVPIGQTYQSIGIPPRMDWGRRGLCLAIHLVVSQPFLPGHAVQDR